MERRSLDWKQELGMKITYFLFLYKHNHDLFDTQFSAMLPAHRKMSEVDIMQMMNMLKFGIIFWLVKQGDMNLLAIVLGIYTMRLLDNGLKFLIMQHGS
ncbi:hypothetical protein Ahy_A07g035507 [Arachis hypogaea]|uniref:Uncharacterized protein n=1 Tax=Arachis hypogaea TaxID=3818 RepID=A0A445CE15_ARAHY|nr:hypothetical protein Ahy_A07g035507 [Arachis hypogaea]